MYLEILPRTVPDSHFDTAEEALDEATRRRTGPMAADSFTRIVESPYGGYRVLTVSRSLASKVMTGPARTGVIAPMDYIHVGRQAGLQMTVGSRAGQLVGQESDPDQIGIRNEMVRTRA